MTDPAVKKDLYVLAFAIVRADENVSGAERIYLAVVYGVPAPARGTWRDHLVWDQDSLVQRETHARDPRASEASCDYEVVETFAVGRAAREETSA